MWVNDERKIAYLHLPKTGGTFIKNCIGGFRKVTKTHIKLREVPNPELYLDYYFFTVVRNPYRRYASQYRHRRRKYENYLASGSTTIPQEVLDALFINLSSLSSYLEWIIKEAGELIVQADYIDHPILKPEIFKYEDTDLSEIIPCEGEKSGETNYWGDYDWKDYVDSKGILLINEYCKRDFEQFGYEMM